ncbi:MAG: hypothetical protein HRU20_12925 [Pseudomonadales bacterium]|nr:hypothetical protein [Pseudomonadales bacterium]
MHGIFLKIYCGMVIATLTVASVNYMLSSALNESRLISYVAGISEGVFVLVAESVVKIPHEKRRLWLSNIEERSGLRINLIKRDALKLTAAEKLKLSDGHSAIRGDVEQKYARVYHAIGSNSPYLLSVDIYDINEQLARLAALLILNELQNEKADPEKRTALIAALNETFTFPIQLVNAEQAKLNYSPLRLHERNELMVFFDEKVLADPALIVYSPTDVDNEFLQLGPIPVFNWAPNWFIFLFVGMSGSSIAVALYLLLRPLQKRLSLIGHELERLELSVEQQPITVTGNDMLSLFAIKVNTMAQRIHNLVIAQRELTQAVSHELRTPIARLKFHVALMEEPAEEDDDNHLQGMAEDINALEGLVDEILTYSQLDQSELMLNICRFNLQFELEKMVQDIDTIRHDVMIELDKQTDLEHVVADPHYLLRACQNLLINAQRYAKSRVKITHYQDQRFFYIEVDDDGEGIDDALKSQIFEPFKRLDSSRNRTSGGYGLGLAIVHQIMRWHDGDITVKDSPMGGCVFTLKWPIVTDLI